MGRLHILSANGDTSNYRMSIMSLEVCAGTWNLLLDRHIIFIQEGGVALGGLSAPSVGGREVSSFAR